LKTEIHFLKLLKTLFVKSERKLEEGGKVRSRVGDKREQKRRREKVKVKRKGSKVRLDYRSKGKIGDDDQVVRRG